MGGHQTLPGQELRPDSPTKLNPTRDILLYTGPEHEHSFLSAGVLYFTAGVVNLPGGVLTVPIRGWALRAGYGSGAALAIGLGGEWLTGVAIIGLVAWLFDPLDKYQGGIIPDDVAQATTLPFFNTTWNALRGTNRENFPLDFQMENWGSFQ